MRTRLQGVSFSFLKLTPDSETPLYIQIAAGIEDAVESGMLQPGQQIPATRSLMGELSISRNTALAAVNRLTQKGLLVSRPGSGVYVADRIMPEARVAASEAPAATSEAHRPRVATPNERETRRTWPRRVSPLCASSSGEPEKTTSDILAGSFEEPPLPLAEPIDPLLPLEPPAAHLSGPGAALRSNVPSFVQQTAGNQADPARPEVAPLHRSAILPQISLNQVSPFPTVRPFRPGIGDHREFPLSLWEQLRGRVIKDFNVDLLAPENPAGHAPLREAVARYLGEVRGVQCTADQVFLTSGLAETIQVITTALMPPDGVVAMEEPGHLHAKAAFLASGARLMPLLVDEEGALPPHGRRKNPPYLLYVTPGHQFPLGDTMSLPRRLGLLDFLRQTGALLLEDDYDREFLEQSDLPATIHSMDNGRSTLYTISFSKLLFSSLRLSAVVVPASHTELFLRAMAVVCGPKPAIDQATLALFFKEGHFVSHIRYLRTIYQNRLNVVRECFASDLKDVVELDTTHAGLHAVGWLERGLDEREVTSTALAAGIDLMPLSSFGRTALLRPGVVVGLAAWQEDEIRRATARLALALGSIRGAGLAMSAAPVGT